jgi:hypothetical protein
VRDRGARPECRRRRQIINGERVKTVCRCGCGLRLPRKLKPAPSSHKRRKGSGLLKEARKGDRNRMALPCLSLNLLKIIIMGDAGRLW